MHNEYFDTSTFTVVKWHTLRAPSTRFPYGLGLDDDNYLVGFGIYPYREEHLPYDAGTQELRADNVPVLVANSYVRYYRPISLAPAVIAENRAAVIRTERDRRLAETDYLMTVDYPISDVDKVVWTNYRQNLRDITALVGFPWNGIDNTPWPVKP